MFLINSSSGHLFSFLVFLPLVSCEKKQPITEDVNSENLELSVSGFWNGSDGSGGFSSCSQISFDSKGTKINDPWPTPFPQSGFYLDAVAVLKSVSSRVTATDNTINLVYPNPAKNKIFVRVDSQSEKSIRIIDVTGRLIKRVTDNDILSGIDISELHSGIYFLEISENRNRSVTRIVKE
jgi:hypothetical protein